MMETPLIVVGEFKVVISKVQCYWVQIVTPEELFSVASSDNCFVLLYIDIKPNHWLDTSARGRHASLNPMHV